MTTSATFRCIVSGNTVTFNGAYDIDQMRKQLLDYEEVVTSKSAPLADDSVKQFSKVKQSPYKGHKDNAASL